MRPQSGDEFICKSGENKMLKEAISNKLEYTRVSVEEQQQRKILGRLAGIIADFKHPTRNDRLYTEELWDKVFKNPLMQEKIQTRTLFGELGHPLDDRCEIDMEKIAICLAEEPKKYPDGTVKGVFDILDTPNGKILKTLCDYGCQIGVSSRGTGEIVEDWNSDKEKVDPNTYYCECWDAVLLPAVKSARMSVITESLDTEKQLKTSLLESIKSASPKAKKVMVETLKKLNIDYSSEKASNTRAKAKGDLAAADSGAELVQSLQESLKLNKTLQEQIKSLQEKLSACNARELQLVEENSAYKNSLEALEVANRQIKTLTEQLTQAQSSADTQSKKLKVVTEQLSALRSRQSVLTESIQKRSDQDQLKITQLTERLKSQQDETQSTIASLNESLEEAKQDSLIIKQGCQKKLQKARELVEHYKQVAAVACDKYINARAIMIGVKASDIKSKLNEGYSFSDIDRCCEELQSYQLQIGTLPFNVSSQDKVRVNIRESKSGSIVPKGRFDDEVDVDLLKWATKN